MIAKYPFTKLHFHLRPFEGVSAVFECWFVPFWRISPCRVGVLFPQTHTSSDCPQLLHSQQQPLMGSSDPGPPPAFIKTLSHCHMSQDTAHWLVFIFVVSHYIATILALLSSFACDTTKWHAWESAPVGPTGQRTVDRWLSDAEVGSLGLNPSELEQSHTVWAKVGKEKQRPLHVQNIYETLFCQCASFNLFHCYDNVNCGRIHIFAGQIYISSEYTFKPDVC